MNSEIATNTFLNRIILLFRRNVMINKRTILIGFISLVCGVVFIKGTVLYYGEISPISAESIVTFGFVIFTLVGYAFTSIMFYEKNSASSAPQFFTLPASPFEKLISAWLLSFCAYTIVGLLLLYVLSLLIGLPADWFFSIKIFNEIWPYVIYQSIFFLGAVHFRSNNFLSTLVTMLGVLILFGLIALLVTNTFTPDGLFFKIPTTLTATSTFRVFITCLLTIVTSAFFIWASYLRLKRMELA